jgi:hypothetical protein
MLRPFLDSERFPRNHANGKWPDDAESKAITEDILANSIPRPELRVGLSVISTVVSSPGRDVRDLV